MHIHNRPDNVYLRMMLRMGLRKNGLVFEEYFLPYRFPSHRIFTRYRFDDAHTERTLLTSTTLWRHPCSHQAPAHSFHCMASLALIN